MAFLSPSLLQGSRFVDMLVVPRAPLTCLRLWEGVLGCRPWAGVGDWGADSRVAFVCWVQVPGWGRGWVAGSGLGQGVGL